MFTPVVRPDKHSELLKIYFKPLAKQVKIIQFGSLILFDWLVGCFGFNSTLRQYFSLYRVFSWQERDKREK